MEQIKKGVVNGKKELLVWFNRLEKPMICHAKTNFKGLGNSNRNTCLLNCGLEKGLRLC